MSETECPEVRFSSTDAQDMVQYRPVSRLAVASMLVGLLSAAAIVNPLACWIALVAVILALASLRTLAKEGSAMLGRKAAVAGLMMGLGFGACGMTRYLARQPLLYREARTHARRWIELVQARRLYEAHQLHLPQEERQPADTDLDKVYQDDPAKQAFRSFFGEAPLKDIVNIGRRGRLRFVGNDGIEIERELGQRIEVISLRYAIDYAEGGTTKSLPFVIGIARRYVEGELRWNVYGVMNADSAGL